ncbi:MAG: hypothetical protein QOE66_2943 [Chloroflexota bacterium]|jgi:hypothetical protein|nr:hypothetical protein [Chloroflexota bacterium]
MHKTIQRTFAVPLGIALIALLALPLAVFANTSAAIAQTGGMTVTMPMPGSGLSVVVTLDVVGNVSQVNIDPVGYTATKLGPHAVTFVNADGTSQVKINAKGDKLAVKASAPTLASFLGSGTWSADLFGTGTATTVGYTIGASGSSPTVAIDSVNAPAGIVVVQGTPVVKPGHYQSSDSVQILFTMNGFTKKLDITISVDNQGTHPASLSITLTGKDKQQLSGTLASLLGDHAWAGHLCDGAPVSFTYQVVDPGTIVFGTATGGTATTKTDGDGLTVSLDGTKTKVKIDLDQLKDLTWQLDVSTRTDKCKDTTAPAPTVNTPVSPDATKADKTKADKTAADAKLASAHVKPAKTGHAGHKGTSKHHGG